MYLSDNQSQKFCDQSSSPQFQCCGRCDYIWEETSCRSGSKYLRHNIELVRGSIRMEYIALLSNALKIMTGFDQVSIYFVSNCHKIQNNWAYGLVSQLLGFLLIVLRFLPELGIWETQIYIFFIVLVLEWQGKRHGHWIYGIALELHKIGPKYKNE